MIVKRFVGYLPTVLLVLSATLLITRVYFHPGVPITHDGENHLARFANYKIALKEGQFPPRFAPNLYHRYGYPTFNYNYPLPNILALPFTLIKLPYQLIFKLIMTSALLGIGCGIYTWLKLLKVGWSGRAIGVLSAVVSPYLFQTVIYRGSIGEVLALALGIWLVVWIERLALPDPKTQTFKALLPQLLIGSLGFILFFLSHNVTVLFGTPLLLLLAACRLRTEKTRLLVVLIACLIGILGSLWFWLPALLEQSAIIVGSSSLAQQYVTHFPTLAELISSPLQFGFSFVGPVDSLSFALGLSQWFVLLSAVAASGLAFLFKQKKVTFQVRPVVIGLSVMTILLIVFQLSFTSGIWKTILLARFIQFPWRLELFTTATLAILTGLIFNQAARWQKFGIIFLLTLQLILISKAQPVGYINKDRIEYEAFEQSTTTSNENLAKDFTFQEFKDWQPTPILESGKGQLTLERWSGSSRSYRVIAETPVTIIEPTMYFLGWQTEVSDPARKRVVPYLNSKTIQGRIAYQLEPGTYQVLTRFGQHTPARIIGNTLSLLTMSAIGGVGLLIIGKQIRQKRA